MTSAPINLWIYDLTPTLRFDLSRPAEAARAWDEAHVVSTLQGIVNRAGPRLYVRFVEHAGRNIDDWWLEHLSQPGRWLSQARRQPIAALEQLVNVFRDDIAGVVVYDASIPATSNVASTVAGVENLVAIRLDDSPGSVYDRLVANGPRLPIIRWIADGTAPQTQRPGGMPIVIGKGGSAKCAAYDLARRTLLDAGHCDPRTLAYYIDSHWIYHATAAPANHHTLTNHDYFVARRAFFCDLSCWGDEQPVDDPRQPLGRDLETFKAILQTLHSRSGGQIIHVGGFTPWAFKYTSEPGAGGRRGGVDTEWELVRLASAYNGFIDADAIGHGAMANASFFAHYPLDDHYPQGGLVASDSGAGGPDEEDRDYVMVYVGDYDSAAWLYQRMPDLWEDPRRGEVPLSWAISPVLAERAPMAMAHLWQTRTANDSFIAADNGAGYLNPSMLVEPRPISGLTSGLKAWTEHCREHYRRWDLTNTGFVIDGHTAPMNDAVLDAYETFSPNGVVAQKTSSEAYLHGEMPVLRCGPDIGEADPSEAAASMLRHIRERRGRALRFHWFRTILKSPSWHADALAILRRQDPHIEPVTAPVFFDRLRRALRRSPVD